MISASTLVVVFPQMLPSASGLSLAVITPPDKTVTATGTSTKVPLGTPEATGTTDINPKYSNNAPGSTAAPTGAVGYWSFDDDLDDKSGSRNPGVAKGDAHITGGALVLDGKGDYVRVENNWNLQLSSAFTISAWVNLDTLTPSSGNYLRIIQKGTSTGMYWMFYVKATKELGFGFISPDGDNQIRTKKTDWQADKWYHVVGTYDPSVSSNNMKIYVDAVLDNQVTKKGKPAVNYQPLIIGTTGTADGDFWLGKLDDMRIYSRALTATEVSNLNKSPFAYLPQGTNVITWKVTDSLGSSATAVQVITVVNSAAITPLTSLALNGVRYTDASTGNTFATSGTHFDLSVNSAVSLTGSYYRFYKADESIFKPGFRSGAYFQIDGAYTDGEYVTEFYSKNSKGVSEPLKQENVILDNTSPTTSATIVSGSSDGRVRLTATDNYLGAGVGNSLTSGIYYKLDSALSYTFVKSNTVEVRNVVNGAHTIYYYGVDNLGNTEGTKSAKFTGVNYTFCSSGCGYNNLQSAINALPSGGGRIYIKDGAYTILNTINLKSGTILDFSAGSSIYFRGDSIPLFRGLLVNNIRIVGGDISAELTGVKAFSFTDSKDIRLERTKISLIKGTGSSAFYCINCSGIYLSNIDAESATRLIDINTSSGTTDGKSSGIWIRDGTFTDSSIEGVKVNHSIDVHLISNTVTNTAENGIDIGWNKNSEVRDNSLTNTGVPNGAAIHTDSANGANVINNYLDTTGQTAVSVYRASNINVVANTIVNAGNQGISIITKLEPCINVKVKLNHVIGSKGFDIYGSPDQSNVQIIFNTIEQVTQDTLPIFMPGSNPTAINFGNVIK